MIYLSILNNIVEFFFFMYILIPYQKDKWIFINDFRKLQQSNMPNFFL